MTSVVQHAPRFTEHDAIRIAKELFALDVTAKPLPSERDQNFHLTAANKAEYVLKIANSTELAEVLDLQNQALIYIAGNRHMMEQNLAVAPQVCLSVNGEQIAATQGDDGIGYHVRLLTYLPGKPLARVKPHDNHLLVSLGRFFGNLDVLLQDFDHPAAYRDFHWDLKNAGRIISEYNGFIEDRQNRALVQTLFQRYGAETEPQLPELRTSLIHSDANDYNVLVGPDGPWQLKVTGVIDFGDMVHSQTINEVAIACAYAMLDKQDPLTAAKAIVAGYHQANPLTQPEIALLYDLICMRLCMSVCHSANQYRHEPDNEYLRISEKPAWDLLNKLAQIQPRLATYTFRHACGLSPVPQGQEIVAWLKQNRGRFGPIVADDLHGDRQLVLDLSVGSLLLGHDGEGGDLDAISGKIFSQIQKAGVAVGIGRYDEARLIYTSEQFKVQADEMAEHRTLHLGLDLYQRSGQPVYAPLGGKVHSFRNNTAPLDYGPTIVLEHQTGGDGRFFTLYGHLSPDSLDGLEAGMPVDKGRLIARVGESATNGGWPPHVHFQIILDMLDDNGNFPGVARPSERDIWLAICPDPNLILGIPEGCFPAGGSSNSEILALRSQNLGRNLSISYDKPLKIVRGRAQYLYTEEGRAYLDGVNNVCHVGHCHPHVVAAGQRQMPVLNTNTRYLHDNIIEYAERLLAKFPEPLKVCYFVCTGSEANELALRLARTYTRSRHIIMVDGAYHGNTQTLIDISPYKHDGPGGTRRAGLGTKSRHAGRLPRTLQGKRCRNRQALCRLCQRDSRPTPWPGRQSSGLYL